MHFMGPEDCLTCPYKDRHILIVGSNKFSTELVAEYIASKTPATWATYGRIEDIPPPQVPENGNWRLIFIDAHGVLCDDLYKLIQSQAAHLLQHDIVALFNIKRECTALLELFDLGVRGFFYEDDHKEMLIKGICAMKSGEVWISRETLMEYIHSRPKTLPAEEEAVVHLTRREREVLTMIAYGTSNEEIASSLYVSAHTVKTHIYNIFKKIGAKNRLQAALWAAKYLHTKLPR